MRLNMVSSKARCCTGYSSFRILRRCRHIPHRSRKTYPSNRLRMGCPCRCLNPTRHPCHPCHRHEITSSTSKSRCPRRLSCFSTAFIYTLHSRHVFGILGSLYSVFLCSCIRSNSQHSIKPSAIRPFHNECIHFLFVVNYRRRPFSVGYYRTSLQMSLGQLISLFPPLLPREHFCLAGLAYQHGRDLSYLQCYTAFSPGRSLVYPPLELAHLQIRVR
jgi:hypothetical protein